MKKLFLLFFSYFSLSICAQNYGDAYNAGYGYGLYDKGKAALCEGDYDEAFDYFTKGTNYNPICYEGIGVCYELGFGVDIDYDEALEAYKTGASYGNMACKSQISRIKREGFWPKSRRSIFLRNLRSSINSGSGVPNVGNGSGYGGSSSSSSSSSSGRTCAGCHGTGKCTSCAGRGEYRGDGYYGTTLYDCPVCKGSGRCGVCYGRGVIR